MEKIGNFLNMRLNLQKLFIIKVNMYKKWEKFMEEYIRKKQKKDRIKKYFIENH